LGFHPLPARTDPPHADSDGTNNGPRGETPVTQLAAAVGNRLAVQAGDPSQIRNAATSDLLSHKPGEQSTHSFITGRQQPIKRAMFSCHPTVWMQSADVAFTLVDISMHAFLGHEHTSLFKVT